MNEQMKVEDVEDGTGEEEGVERNLFTAVKAFLRELRNWRGGNASDRTLRSPRAYNFLLFLWNTSALLAGFAMMSCLLSYGWIDI